MKTVKRSIIICALTLLMCVSLLVGVTFAWFTDTITNSGNIITAGNIAVEWKYREAQSDSQYADVTEDTALFSDSDLWQPGYSKSFEFKVGNIGSLPFDWKLSIENVEPYGGQNLAGHITVTADYTFDLASGTVIKSGSNLAAGGTTDPFTVTITIDGDSTGDTYQNTGVSFDLVLTANQVGMTSGFNASISVGANL